jgi:hypothetical protein
MESSQRNSKALRVSDFLPSPVAYADKRRDPRFSCENVIDILPCEAREPWRFRAAELRDCSARGIGIVVTDELMIGEQFLVKLLLGGSITLLVYTVRHCQPFGRSAYAVGAEFSGFAATPIKQESREIMEALLCPRLADAAG